MKLTKTLPLLAALTLVSTAFAWHEAGHRAVGKIAFDNLDPEVKAMVVNLLKSLPNRATPKNSVAPPDPFHQLPPNFRLVGRPRLARASLEDAAVWPDKVRMTWLHRATWHYINFSINGPGGNAPEIVGTGKAITVLPFLVSILRDPGQPKTKRAMALAWIAHLVGDIHQPLHAVAYVDTAHPGEGDHGGNGYFLNQQGIPVKSPNLHSIWDGVVGEGITDEPALLGRLSLLPPPTEDLLAFDLPNPKPTFLSWAQESVALSKQHVYQLDADGKPGLTASAWLFKKAPYVAGIRAIADQRVHLAGYRLAAVLNAALR